jgi:hypothetical protein
MLVTQNRQPMSEKKNRFNDKLGKLGTDVNGSVIELELEPQKFALKLLIGQSIGGAKRTGIGAVGHRVHADQFQVFVHLPFET